MRKLTRIALIGGTASVMVVGGSTAAALAATHGDDHDGQEPAAMRAAVKISEKQAEGTAKSRVPGARVTESELGREHGKAVWEIDLIKQGREYEVTVDANTGKVVRAHQDGDDHGRPDRHDGDDDASQPKTAKVKVSRSQAETIAKSRVAGARVTESELEREHGKVVWEIDLIKQGREYEVTVDANTGKVVKSHQDSHDHGRHDDHGDDD